MKRKKTIDSVSYCCLCRRPISTSEFLRNDFYCDYCKKLPKHPLDYQSTKCLGCGSKDGTHHLNCSRYAR